MTAEQFLKAHSLKMRVTLSDSKPPPWEGPRGHHYRVTITSKRRRMVFDYWGSAYDAIQGNPPVHEDILSLLDTELQAIKGREAYIRDFGKPGATLASVQEYTRLKRFTDRLKAFFRPNELKQLTTIHK